MEFNKAYNRQEFVNFLQNSFLPDDFIPGETPVEFRTKMNYTRQAVKLGSSESLDLIVYEVRHISKMMPGSRSRKRHFVCLPMKWKTGP